MALKTYGFQTFPLKDVISLSHEMSPDIINYQRQ